MWTSLGVHFLLFDICVVGIEFRWSDLAGSSPLEPFASPEFISFYKYLKQFLFSGA